MTNFRTLLVKHWDKLLIGAITLGILMVTFVPFLLKNSLDKFDTPGLLSLSWFIREYTFPDFQGWNPYFAAGFPQGTLYPPLFHYLVAALGKIISLQLAYKLLVTIAGLCIPASIYYFNRKIYKQKSFALLSTLVILLGLIIMPGYLGFNFDGLFDYGLAPSFVSIPLFFTYLGLLFDKKSSSTKLAVIFSILVLTHLLTAAVAGIITLIWVVSGIKDKKLAFAQQLVQPPQQFIKLIKLGLLTFLLTAFWTIPFLTFKQYSASGFAMQVSGMFPAFILFLVLIIFLSSLFTKKIKNKKVISLIVPCILIAILGIADSILNRTHSRFSIPLIHPFRLQMYGIILVLSCLTLVVENLHPLFIKIAKTIRVMKYIKRSIHICLNLFLGILVLSALILFRLNPRGVEEVILKDNPGWDGRAARVYKISEVLDQSRAVIDKSVMENPGNFAVDGLLKESSYFTPYFQSLEKSLNPDNYQWDKLDQYYIENKQIPQEKVEYLANLLWVKSLFAIDRNFPDCEDFKQITSFTTNSVKEGLVKRNIYMCNYTPTGNSKFIEVLTEEPEVITTNWNQALDAWWLSENQQLFIDKKLSIQELQAESHEPTYHFSGNYQQLKITTNSNEEIPVLIKMSYFPKWKAYDKDGNKLEIYRVSPNLMVVPTKEEITLKYERTVIEWITLIISIISWLGLLTYVILKRKLD